MKTSMETQIKIKQVVTDWVTTLLHTHDPNGVLVQGTIDRVFADVVSTLEEASA